MVPLNPISEDCGSWNCSQNISPGCQLNLVPVADNAGVETRTLTLMKKRSFGTAKASWRILAKVAVVCSFPALPPDRAIACKTGGSCCASRPVTQASKPTHLCRYIQQTQSGPACLQRSLLDERSSSLQCRRAAEVLRGSEDVAPPKSIFTPPRALT